MNKQIGRTATTLVGIMLAEAGVACFPKPMVAEMRAIMTSALYKDTSIGRRVTGPIQVNVNTLATTKVAVVEGPKHGSATIHAGTPQGWTYKPAPDFLGYDEFLIRTSSGSATRVVVMVRPRIRRRVFVVDSLHGDDMNSGSLSRPLATIQAAEGFTRPGDTVLIRTGVYTETSNEAVLQVSRSGLPGAYITYRAYPGEHPVLHTRVAWNTILIVASYIRIEGLDIAGNAPNTTIADAAKVANRFMEGSEHQTFGPETSAYETNGIFIQPADVKARMDKMFAPRHIEIVGNYVHDCQGGGISASQSDYVTVEGNRVERNAVRSMYATSGISLLGLQNTDFEQPAYKDRISDNVLIGNETKVVWAAIKKMSDGNGIMLDSNRNSEDSTGEPYSGRILVVNNIVSESGGAGIQVYATDNVDVFFNTVYHNSVTPGLNYGQIWCHKDSKVRVMNNIAVAGEGGMINEKFNDTQNVVYDYNVYFGGKYPDLVGLHDLVANPRFVNEGKRDFQLTLKSPALDSAVGQLGVKRDNAGHLRPSGTAPDRGALELQQ